MIKTRVTNIRSYFKKNKSFEFIIFWNHYIYYLAMSATPYDLSPGKNFKFGKVTLYFVKLETPILLIQQNHELKCVEYV